MASTATAERKPKRKGRGDSEKASLTTEQRSTIAGLITEHPTATDAELAAMVGVNRTTVLRIRDRMNVNTEETTEEYGRRLGKRLPMAERVRLWAKLARGKTDPRLAFAQKAALQRVEELIGHVTRKEQREAEANASAPGPIFVFPAGMVPSAAPVTLPVVVDAEARVVSKDRASGND